MELGSSEIDRGHLLIRNLDGLRIAIGVQLAPDGETRSRGCAGDQVDDGTIADQRLGAPVQADEREEPVLDLVPFAGARRKGSSWIARVPLHRTRAVRRRLCHERRLRYPV